MKLRKGFTLIELLVVIAIIALLLSILMPSLQKVKKQAQAVICRSNLKQWGIAMILYTQDYEEKYWHGWGGFGINDSNWWQGAMRPYYENIGEIRNCPSATKPMDDLFLGENRGPGAGKWPFAAWGVTNFLGGEDYGSYIANGWLEYVDDKPQAMVDDLKSAGHYKKYWRKKS